MRKYRNVPTVYNGRRYDSKKEAKYAKLLDMLRLVADSEGRVIMWFPQVPFKFKCGTKMIVDFLICFADGRWELHDTKGGQATKTQVYRIKKKMLKHEYGLDIKEV
jgi:hypothetical protein